MNINEMNDARGMDRLLNKMQRDLQIKKAAALVAMEERALVAHALAEVSKAEERNNFLFSKEVFASPTAALDVTGFSGEMVAAVSRLTKLTTVGNKHILRPKIQTPHLTEEAAEATLKYLCTKAPMLTGETVDNQVILKAAETIKQPVAAASGASGKASAKAKVSVK
jgi:hypothetical protein